MSSSSRHQEKRPFTIEENECPNRQHIAYNFVRRMRNLEDKWGKQWVQTKEEFDDPYGTPSEVMTDWAGEERFIKELHQSDGCTKKEMNVYMAKLKQIFPAKIKEYQDGLWHTWLTFREAQRTGLYDPDQKLYAYMLQRLEEEDQRELAHALSLFDTDTEVQRLIELEKERDRYMSDEYAVDLANPGYETWNNRWTWN